MSKLGPWCAVSHCYNRRGNPPGMHFFHFPRDPQRCHLWIEKCQRHDLKDKEVAKISNNYVLCEQHFATDAFVNPNHIRLNGKAVPSIFDTHVTIDKNKNDSEQTVLNRDRGMEIIIPDEDNKYSLSHQLGFEIGKTVLEVEYDEYNSFHVEEDILNCKIKTEPSFGHEEEEIKMSPNHICNTEYLNNKDLRHIQKGFQEINSTNTQVNYFNDYDFSRHNQNGKVFSLKENCVLDSQVNPPESKFIGRESVKETKNEESLLEKCKLNIKKELEWSDSFTMKDLKLFSKCLVVCERLNIKMENDENENFSNGKICSEQDFNFYRRKTIENTLNSYLDNKAKDKGNRQRKRLKCEADHDIKKFKDKCNSLKVKNLLLRPNKCQYIFCRERFRRKHFLKKYLVILPREKFKCKICQINFSNYLIYRTHLSIHCGKRSFAYSICKGKFNFNFDLKRHGKIQQKISTSNNNYHCKDCNKHFKFQYILKNHLKRHNIDKSFCCSFCTKSFKTKSELIQHQISHSEDRPHKCKVCGKIFKTKPHLVNHVSTHSEDRPFQCDVCRKSFKLKSYLSTHKRLHSNEKPFLCNFCGKRFNLSSGLQSHKKIHDSELSYSDSGSNPYLCEHCGKSFTIISNFRSHLKTHCDERKFQCETCGKLLKTRRNLFRHYQSHSDERPHICELCGKGFKSKSNLVSHKMSHSDLRSHQCEVCKKAFRKKQSLKWHKLKNFH